MLKKLVFLIAILCMQSVAFGEVITTRTTEGYADYVYVAGDCDNYPIEYYDDENGEYRGIIPDILSLISERQGINFAYINGDKTDRLTFLENNQADIISSVSPDIIGLSDYIVLVDIEDGSEKKDAGIGFTQIIDSELALKVKQGAMSVTDEEKNGIYLSYANEKSSVSVVFITIVLLLLLIATGLCIFFALHIKKIKRLNDNDKLTDPETGLGNLQFFLHHFNFTISDAARNLYYIAYIYLDSGYLRSYVGDDVCDEVIKYTALVVSECCADREISARVADNGFVFLYQAVNDDDAKNRMSEVISRLNESDEAKKQSKPLFYASYYHLLPSDRSCELLILNLKKYCNRIFGTDRQTVLCDVRSMYMVQEEKKITESILYGLDNNEFKMYLQFVVDNKTKRITSAEALSRWDSREKGLVMPNKYIENMEMSGLISRHDFHIFELCCRQLEKWSKTELSNIIISCNFTRITLSEKDFINKLKTISDGYEFDRTKLAIEITEDAIEKDTQTATENVSHCKELGFLIYLDDLGSGYTSLANLCDYPIDVVKIDRDILLKSDTKRGRDLFSGIIALAHSLEILVICEGVETAEHNSFVSASPCDFIQGWYYSKPLPLEECEVFVKKFDKEPG